ncbi:MAG: hypothetical protein ACTSVU_08990 [Promethearchaeota archaeon]
MEELIKLKDEEIAQLTKVKDLLRGQVKKLRDENISLKNTQPTTNPEDLTKISDLEKQITDLTQKNSELTKIIQEKEILLETTQKAAESSKNDFSQELEKQGKIKESLDLMKKNLEEISLERDKLKEELEKQPLSPEKLMEQLKTGMLKLGQQNFSINKKVDQILESIENGGFTPSQTISKQSYRSPAVQTDPSLKTVSPTESHSRGRSGLKSPAVSTGIPREPEVSPDTSVYQQRKPSDVMKSQKSSASATTKNVAPGGILSVPYPNDGAIKCPHCGAQNFVEQEDHTRVLSYVPIKKYAKKYYCKTCRAEWKYD